MLQEPPRQRNQPLAGFSLTANDQHMARLHHHRIGCNKGGRIGSHGPGFFVGLNEGVLVAEGGVGGGVAKLAQKRQAAGWQGVSVGRFGELAEVGRPNIGRVDALEVFHRDRAPLGKQIEIVGGAVFVIANEGNTRLIASHGIDLLLYIGQPEIIAVKPVAHTEKLGTLRLLSRQTGADHRLTLSGAPGVANIRCRHVTAKDNQNLVSLNEGCAYGR